MLFRIGAAQKSELLIFLVAISSDATCFVLNISYLTLHVSDCSLCGAAQKSAAIIYFPFLSAQFFCILQLLVQLAVTSILLQLIFF